MIEIALRIVSVQNESCHYRARAKRHKLERETVAWSLKTTKKPALPVTVKLTRIAPRPLDSHDNLRAGFKPSADAIATWLGVKDNDSDVTWTYGQEKGAVRDYRVRIEFL